MKSAIIKVETAKQNTEKLDKDELNEHKAEFSELIKSLDQLISERMAKWRGWVGRASCVVGRASWVVRRESCVVGRGSWVRCWASYRQ